MEKNYLGSLIDITKGNKFYGYIGQFAQSYNGVDYYVGDVVSYYSNASHKTMTTIICYSESLDRFLPMWLSDFNYCKTANIKLTKVKNYYELKDGEVYCDNLLKVQFFGEYIDRSNLNKNGELYWFTCNSENFYGTVGEKAITTFSNPYKKATFYIGDTVDYYDSNNELLGTTIIVKSSISGIIPMGFGSFNPFGGDYLRLNKSYDTLEEGVTVKEYIKYKDCNSNSIDDTIHTLELDSEEFGDTSNLNIIEVMGHSTSDLFLCLNDYGIYQLQYKDGDKVLYNKSTNTLFNIKASNCEFKFKPMSIVILKDREV